MRVVERAVLSDGLRQQWIEACRQRLPHEACGVIHGSREGNLLRIDGFSPVRNAAAAPARAFFFDPAAWVRVWYEAKRTGKPIAGVFHSHPDGTAQPSLTDTIHRLNWGTYWIVGMAREGVEIAGYLPDEDAPRGWRPIRLEIV